MVEDVSASGRGEGSWNAAGMTMLGRVRGPFSIASRIGANETWPIVFRDTLADTFDQPCFRFATVDVSFEREREREAEGLAMMKSRAPIAIVPVKSE